MPRFQFSEAFGRGRREAEALNDSRRLITEQRQELENRDRKIERQAEALEKARRLARERKKKIERQAQALGNARRLIGKQKETLQGKDREIEKQARALKQARRRKRMLQKNTPGQHVREVQGLSTRLHDLGFTERALDDLRSLAADDSKPALKKLAAWELAVWHADQGGEEDARQGLELLSAALRGEKDLKNLRQAAILEAECQEALGNVEAARLAISRALASGPHTDLYFAAANLEGSAPAKIESVNRVLQLHGISEISFDASAEKSLLDSLRPGRDAGDRAETPDDPKVSVIMPAYNAEGVIRTALDSVLSQTWTNLEVLVVDDCSTDATVPIVEDRARKDHRVRLIRAESNGGTYVARNLGLGAATGALVTCHDADDWSHPEKIERQVRHLLSDPEIMCNLSQHVRVTPDLRFYRRQSRSYLLSSNMSSFMFRREPVMEAIGYWDCVRFAADDEFIRRAKRVFGEERVVQMPTGPLSFQRQSSGSLTQDGAFGWYGYKMGSRREYSEAYTRHHDTAENLRYEFPQDDRPFAVPEPMWPEREAREADRRHFDVVLASDFRLSDGTTSSNVAEIEAQRRMGLRTGLIQLPRYDLDPGTGISREVRGLLDGDRTQMLVYGEEASCDALILRGPASLQERQRFVPDVEAANVHVIADEAPMTRYDDRGEPAYTIDRCERHLREYFGKAGVWYPIDPSVREALREHHAEELTEITLANEDWPNLLDAGAWRRESRPPRGPRTRIGRHREDRDAAWPADPSDLLAVFPDSGEYEVRVLGGAGVPQKALGGVPENWHVQKFGEVHPKDFLAALDVFVDFARADSAEASGRSAIEAMAVGVPVILPHGYRELFGEAAIYAKPAEVKENIDRLMADDDYYESRVRIARDHVEAHFGYALHAERLGQPHDVGPGGSRKVSS